MWYTNNIYNISRKGFVANAVSYGLFIILPMHGCTIQYLSFDSQHGITFVYIPVLNAKSAKLFLQLNLSWSMLTRVIAAKRLCGHI